MDNACTCSAIVFDAAVIVVVIVIGIGIGVKEWDGIHVHMWCTHLCSISSPPSFQPASRDEIQSAIRELDEWIDSTKAKDALFNVAKVTTMHL